VIAHGELGEGDLFLHRSAEHLPGTGRTAPSRCSALQARHRERKE
jgi:hypothetical protein